LLESCCPYVESPKKVGAFTKVVLETFGIAVQKMVRTEYSWSLNRSVPELL
jgi:hypothetical protein